ncbi:ABC transporter permease [Thermodesulfobacteriota bacterium]
MNDIKSKDIGFNTKNLIFFQIDDEKLVEHYPAFKEEILRIAGVKHMTASNYVPWSHGTMPKFAYYDDDAVVIANTIFADSSFLETYQIPVVDGEGFSTKWTEMPGYVIINETARQVLQSTGTDPLSKALGIHTGRGVNRKNSFFWQHRVHGIINDFSTLYPPSSIQPLAILPSYHVRYVRIYITIRLADHNQTNILSQVEEVVKHFYPQSLFDFKYVTEEMENMHHRKMDGYLKTIIFTVGFAIFITMIGLFGYATYETDRCTKEIGVRKALGAKPVQIAKYFILRFVKLVLIANIISWPISYLFTQWALKEYDCFYTLQISIKHLLLVGVSSLLIAIVVVSVQVYRAALVDPASVLRYE